MAQLSSTPALDAGGTRVRSGSRVRVKGAGLIAGAHSLGSTKGAVPPTPPRHLVWTTSRCTSFRRCRSVDSCLPGARDRAKRVSLGLSVREAGAEAKATAPLSSQLRPDGTHESPAAAQRAAGDGQDRAHRLMSQGWSGHWERVDECIALVRFLARAARMRASRRRSQIHADASPRNSCWRSVRDHQTARARRHLCVYLPCRRQAITGPVEALRLGTHALVRRDARSSDTGDEAGGIRSEIVSQQGTGTCQRHRATQSDLASGARAR
jgi:hypothetical protein